MRCLPTALPASMQAQYDTTSLIKCSLNINITYLIGFDEFYIENIHLFLVILLVSSCIHLFLFVFNLVTSVFNILLHVSQSTFIER